jgi:Fe2+ or Zn2+ uptake regulation protein
MKIWRLIPLQQKIMETLRQLGSCTDDELLKALDKEEKNVTPEILSRALLQLEVRGLIRVLGAPKGRRKIEAK